MKLTHIALIFIFVAFFSTFQATANTKLTIAVNKDLEQRYQELLDKNKVDAIHITDVAGKHATRALVQLIIIKQALYKGGLNVDFDFFISPNLKRSSALLSNGEVVISSFLTTEKSQPKDTFISSPVIESRTLKKGIYGLASNKALMKVKSLDDLKPLRGVLQSSWANDIETLKNHNITKIELVTKYENINTRIAYRGLDYTLLEFPFNEELIQFSQKIKLHPVPNISIALEGTRHFFISKNHPNGERVFTALEKGLKIMKNGGTIEKYFQQIKVIRNDLNHFKVLNNK